MNAFMKALLCCAIGLLITFFPVPIGMDPRGWTLFAIFVSTILGLILKPLPMGPVTLIALCVTALTNTLNMEKECLTALSSPTIWLIVFVSFIARSIIKTRLGIRIAYLFIRLMGKNSLGLGYSLTFAEFLLSPMIPSNGSRAVGIMFPIVRSISQALGSYPNEASSEKIGSFLTQVYFQASVITSAMFLTAMAANPLSQAIAAKQGVTITWMNWASAAFVPGILSLLILPLIIYKLSPPTLKNLPQALTLAKDNLAEMGPLSRAETYTLWIFAGMVFLWIFGPFINVSACTTALLGLCLLLSVGVLSWEDILNEKEAWNVLIWLSTLITLSTFLEKFGFISWFSGGISHMIHGFSLLPALLILGGVYFYSHYFFASNTAHASSMYGAFLGVAFSLGAPPLLTALILGFFNSLFSSMTHYGTTPAPVIYGAGYVPITVWWRNGFIISVINLSIWLGIGSLWWKFLGLF